MATLRLAIVDDHTLLRDGLHLVFDVEDDFEIVGEAATAAEAVRLVRMTNPDIVLLDLMLPGMDGSACLDVLRQQNSSTRVVILSAVDDAQIIERTLRRGASAYVLKTIDPFELPGVLRQLVEQTVFQASVFGSTDTAHAARSAGLSEKEISVLTELGHGGSNKEIAKALWLSEQTVKFHLRNIYRKLGLTGRTEALRYAHDTGLAGAAT
jgi:DNA-binding NarL/FixJ family response regulator